MLQVREKGLLRRICLFLFLSAVLLCVSGMGTALHAAKEEAAPAPAFSESPAWKKLDAKLQASWQNAVTAQDREQKLHCFVKVQDPFDMGDRSFLISAGFQVQMIAGSVASGTTSIGNLQNIAELPFVKSIQWARP